jgi:dihydrofolate reductase
MRVEPQLVSEALMRDDHAGEQRSARGLVVEVTEDVVDQTRHLGEQATIVTEKRPECLGHSEDELSMRQLEQNLVCQIFGEEDRSFATARWAQVEPLARERPKVVVTAFGIGAAYPRDALEIVAARRKALAQLLDTLKAIPAVGGGVLLVVLLAEVGEVAFKYGMELVAATGNVPIPRRGRDRDCRAHIIVYERNQLFASERELVHRSPHNVSHSPDAFSSLRSCEGAGDAVVMERVPQLEDTDYGYKAFYDSIDTVLLGRKTYEQILGFDCDYPYQDKNNIVFSSRPIEGAPIPIRSEQDPVEVVQEEVQLGGRDIWLVGGAGLNGTLLEAGLVDRIILTTIPVVLGKGIPLLRNVGTMRFWQLENSESYPNGVIQSTYQVQTTEPREA